MEKFDTDLTPVERMQAIAALKGANATGQLDNHIAQMKAEFNWDRSNDFYRGYVNGLMAAIDLLKSNVNTDRSMLGRLLLVQCGLVLQHQIDEAEAG
jgi:hypothetical protein